MLAARIALVISIALLLAAAGAIALARRTGGPVLR
jgi:hypothetical protein